ncbi:hypothetical protein [Streptomyces sp. SID5643]|uniref:hypothetical protein n=1 Tax=Streptomyces sp. SID5643 TaxID=2690307 RepID=UPI0013698ABA|nr:hypothetical protein [Streptomyces sp. SID5643]MZF89987.1 hypothetical protein [Streptomyces sp. SID5643]
MTRSGRARWWMLRSLALLVLMGGAGLVFAWAEPPEWTMGVPVVLWLMVDDVLRHRAKKREAGPGRTG